jgi:hypothetical protein
VSRTGDESISRVCRYAFVVFWMVTPYLGCCNESFGSIRTLLEHTIPRYRSCAIMSSLLLQGYLLMIGIIGGTH